MNAPATLRLAFLVWAVAIAVFLLAGCSSVGSMFENRLACSLDRQEAYFLSKWTRVAIGATIAPSDTAVVCQGGK
jgi:hypothetical protein